MWPGSLPGAKTSRGCVGLDICRTVFSGPHIRTPVGPYATWGTTVPTLAAPTPDPRHPCFPVCRRGPMNGRVARVDPGCPCRSQSGPPAPVASGEHELPLVTALVTQEPACCLVSRCERLALQLRCPLASSARQGITRQAHMNLNHGIHRGFVRCKSAFYVALEVGPAGGWGIGFAHPETGNWA